MKTLFLLLTFFVLFPTSSRAEKAKNVILFVGDGMGPTVLSATRLQFFGPEGQLEVDKFSNLAKVKTYSLNDFVTDSAAAATSMSSGIKVNNGVIGPWIHKNGQPTKAIDNSTILELASKANLATGLVTTVESFHATPASFFARNKSRKQYEEIVNSMFKSPVDVILGGGDRYIKNFEQYSNVKTQFTITRGGFQATDCIGKKILGVYAPASFPFVLDRPKGHMNLPKMTEMALKCLVAKKKKGFFVMIEAGRIDQALHARKIREALHETKELDASISAAIKYLKKIGQLKDTLILVTADHDTGGLAINGPVGTPKSLFEKKNGKVSSIITRHYSGKGPDFRVLRLSTDRTDIKNIPFTTHTGTDVNLYGMGPGSHKVKGTVDNTEIYNIMKESLGL
jgi:alkaline phosphatase